MHGFKSNYSKKHTETDKICLGGFVVENEVRLSRKKLKEQNITPVMMKDKIIYLRVMPTGWQTRKLQYLVSQRKHKINNYRLIEITL